VRLIPAENKNTAVFATTISLGKITNTSLTEVTVVSTTNLCHERKQSLLLIAEGSSGTYG